MQNGYKDYCYLDKIRINYGIDKCREVFLNIYKIDKWTAVALLNDSRLTFPCLFIFLRIIEVMKIKNFLSYQNITVLNIIDRIQNMERYRNGKDYLSAHKEVAYPILKWILETGCADDGLDNEYEEIMDVTVSVLINIYRDKSILPAVADMIFLRNRKGHFIHDLVWAFFQSCTPYALKLIAERICYSDQQDIDLACQLLNIEALKSRNSTKYRQKQYLTYIKWLDENDKFLYFTGESLQFSSNPILCKVDLERKYMNKGSTSYSMQSIVPEDENEKKLLKAYKMLSDEEKIVLSEFSHKLYHKSISEWKKWMNAPIDDQIEIAKAGWEE